MTKKFAFAAAVFALLTVTAPARAATVDVEAVNLQFAGGNQLAGNIDFTPFGYGNPYDPSHYYTGFEVVGEPNVTYNGSPVTIWQYAQPPTNPALTFLIPADVFLNIDTSNIRGLNFADFTLSGAVATSGTVSCVSGCDVNAVPLPAALPLFGSALLALAGLATRSRRAGRG